MNVAIISDIHGSCLALDAVLADLSRDPADRIVCLGDAIQGGPQPEDTATRLREMNCPVVLGNADAFVLTGQGSERETLTEQQLLTRDWSLAQLSHANRAFLAGFPPTVSVSLSEDRTLLCFHGSPTSFDDLIRPDTPEADIEQLLGGHGSTILAGGHAHLQQLRQVGDAFFFNPGSVGAAQRHHPVGAVSPAAPWAEYAVLTVEDGRLGVEFRRVLLPVDEIIRVILASGMPNAEAVAARYQPRSR